MVRPKNTARRTVSTTPIFHRCSHSRRRIPYRRGRPTSAGKSLCKPKAVLESWIVSGNEPPGDFNRNKTIRFNTRPCCCCPLSAAEFLHSASGCYRATQQGRSHAQKVRTSLVHHIPRSRSTRAPTQWSPAVPAPFRVFTNDIGPTCWTRQLPTNAFRFVVPSPWANGNDTPWLSLHPLPNAEIRVPNGEVG
jgi:hypothetical protein